MSRPELATSARRLGDHGQRSRSERVEHSIFTLVVGGETFGLPVGCVHTIFRTRPR